MKGISFLFNLGQGFVFNNNMETSEEREMKFVERELTLLIKATVKWEAELYALLQRKNW